ncbi:MaoC family dehydratase [Streptomyces anulatus]|uniref:MaoC family dehydratase n=1 Tax=Streptomyces TaxID=1883 RepID=UPI000BEF7BCE|nr:MULTISPECIES: MaoC family dehydratase [unclassified Streptomyces]WTD14398.1 MaoC family dehydratase [Streptomyces anulatus]WTE07708.1 MaoC family dehydratase [Streptomyces anulatus]
MTLRHVKDNEYVEEHGGDYEDFEPGMVIQHWPGRTLSEADNTWLTLLTMNQHPLHFDQHYGAGAEYGKVLVNSGITLCLVGGMTVQALSARAVANLGWDKVRLKSPVFVGDTLYATSRILDKRLSRSRPGQGIITVETTGTKATGETVIVFERSFMVRCRELPDPPKGQGPGETTAAVDGPPA